MAPAFKPYFEITQTLKENNFNFELTIYLKSQAERQAAKR
jgi:hypothetical protein